MVFLNKYKNVFVDTWFDRIAFDRLPDIANCSD